MFKIKNLISFLVSALSILPFSVFAIESAHSFSAWPIISLVFGLVIGLVSLFITIIVILKSGKFLLPLLVYFVFFIISLFLIGFFVYNAVNYASDSTDVVNENVNAVNINTQNTYSNDTYALKAEGKIKNADYNFIVDVGKEYIDNITVKKNNYPLEGITDSYYFCYDTANSDYYGYECDWEQAILFSVHVYTEAQYQALSEYAFMGSFMGQDGGYYFVLSHPNGLMPDDMPANDSYYDQVVTSIDFAD